MLFLRKTVFIWELSELLRGEFDSFEKQIRGICGKPHAAAWIM